MICVTKVLVVCDLCISKVLVVCDLCISEVVCVVVCGLWSFLRLSVGCGGF